PRGADDTALLAPVDRTGTAAVAARPPEPHFHEYQHLGAVGFAVEHHQVQLAQPVAGVGGHRLQASANQVLARGLLDRAAACAGVAQPPPSGTTCPPLKVAHAGVRSTLPKPSSRSV